MVNPSSTRNKLQVIGLDLSNGRAVASELLRYSYRLDYPTVLDREAGLLEFRTRLETLQLFDTGEPPPPLPIARYQLFKRCGVSGSNGEATGAGCRGQF